MFKTKIKIALITILLAASPAIFAQSGEFTVFATANEQGSVSVDYMPYSDFFNALSVQERGRTLVAYEAVRENALSFMTSYSDFIAQVDVTRLSRDDQLAFWLNTRNFLVVKALSEESSFRNFDDKRGTPSAPGPLWTEPRITINGVNLSIHNIEKDILLAGWDSPYVLYGLYQGLEGGPALPAKPFQGDTVQATLAEIASEYADDNDIFRVRRGNVRLGEFYEWYAPIVFDGDNARLAIHVAEAAGSRDTIAADARVRFRDMSSAVEHFRPRQTFRQDDFRNRGGVRGSGS